MRSPPTLPPPPPKKKKNLERVRNLVSNRVKLRIKTKNHKSKVGVSYRLIGFRMAALKLSIRA